jgi:hypothetical protein
LSVYIDEEVILEKGILVRRRPRHTVAQNLAVTPAGREDSRLHVAEGGKETLTVSFQRVRRAGAGKPGRIEKRLACAGLPMLGLAKTIGDKQKVRRDNAKRQVHPAGCSLYPTGPRLLND